MYSDRPKREHYVELKGERTARELSEMILTAGNAPVKSALPTRNSDVPSAKGQCFAGKMTTVMLYGAVAVVLVLLAAAGAAASPSWSSLAVLERTTNIRTGTLAALFPGGEGAGQLEQPVPSFASSPPPGGEGEGQQLQQPAPSFGSPSPPAGAYTKKNVALAAGHDLEAGSHTAASAEARCDQLRACCGFTFAANVSDPRRPTNVYFKSLCDGNADSKWWSYLKPLAEFRFANTYGDHMVLQQNVEAQLWGFAEAGAEVTVTTTPGGGRATATVAADGMWQVALAPVPASMTPYNISATSGGKTIYIEDVLYGDVWFCSGQSNMQFALSQSFNAKAEIAAAGNFPHIRLFTVADVASNVSLVELAKVLEPWSVSSTAAVSGAAFTYFSATCWFFGKKIAEKKGYPIGLIDSSWGGTRIEAWMDPAARAKCNATAQQLPPPPRPEDSSGGASSPVRVASGENPNAVDALWNSMVVPWLKTSIYGVVWYQGEADCEGGYPQGNHFSSVNYACTFPAMIASWREHWHQLSGGSTPASFPFGFVQLSTWSDKSNHTCGDRLSPQDSASCDVGVVRWGQTANRGFVPNPLQPDVFMAVAVDLGDPASPYGDIHPRYKSQVGVRLALSGLAVAYHDPDTPFNSTTGPIATSATRGSGGGAVLVAFRNTGGVPLTLKHQVGFEVSPAACDLAFPASEPKGTWLPATSVTRTGESSLLVSAGGMGGAVRCIRYNWYNAACMPGVGPELCAVYGKAAPHQHINDTSATEDLLPAPPFIMAVEPK